MLTPRWLGARKHLWSGKDKKRCTNLEKELELEERAIGQGQWEWWNIALEPRARQQGTQGSELSLPSPTKISSFCCCYPWTDLKEAEGGSPLMLWAQVSLVGYRVEESESREAKGHYPTLYTYTVIYYTILHCIVFFCAFSWCILLC